MKDEFINCQALQGHGDPAFEMLEGQAIELGVIELKLDRRAFGKGFHDLYSA